MTRDASAGFPAPLRDWSALIAAALVAWAFSAFVFTLTWSFDLGGDCVTVAQIFDRPLDALLGTPRGDPAAPRGTFWFDSGCVYSSEPDLVRAWVAFWLPLAFGWVGAGYLAARWARTASHMRAAMAGAIPALVTFGYALIEEFRRQEFFGYTDRHRLYPGFATGVLVAIVIVAAGAGMAGGWARRRQQAYEALRQRAFVPFGGRDPWPGE